MVTEIIKQEDINEFYLDIDYWIENGITNDAVYLVVNTWAHTHKPDMSEIRNRRKPSNQKYIPLTKW